MTDLPAVIGSRPLRPRSSACPHAPGEGARTPSRSSRGGTGRLLLLASLAGLNLAVARPAAAANCGVTFHDLPAIQIARGGSTDLPIPYQIDGPCAWRITPSVEANPLGITGTFVYSPAPAQPSNTSLILGTLTAPPAAPLGTQTVRIRLDGIATYQGQSFDSSPVELPVAITVVPAPPPTPIRPTLTGYSATSPRGVPIFSAPPGAPLLIEGSNLGTTGTVAFNGIAATASSWSPAEILVTVPPAPSYPFAGPVTVTTGGQTATGPVFTITAPPVSLNPQALQVIGTGLTHAGQALLGSRDGLAQADPGQLMAVTAQGLTAASVAVQQSARQLAQLKTQGLALSDDWLSDYSTMGGALSVAARFSSRGSFDETRIALQLFAAELASTFPTTPDAAHPEVGATFATARDEALTSADIAGLLANLPGDGRVARQLAAVASQLDQGPDGLERTADSFLAFDDPSLRHALGLDDPLVAGGLQNIRVLSAEPAVIDWSKAVLNDPNAWASARLPYAFTESLVQMGDSLGIAGNQVLAVSSGFTCEDDCTVANGKLDCGVVDLGLSTGGADTTTPDDLKSLGKALDLLALVPGSKLSPLGEAAQQDVLKAMKGLVSTLKNVRPTVWIKVGWKQCESERCFPYVWTTHNTLVAHTSGWTKVELPDSFTGKRVDQWDGRDLQAIRDAAAKKAKELCR